MDNQILEDQRKFVDEVQKILDNNMISHAYFLEHNNYSKYREVLKYLCREFLKKNTSPQNLSLINDNFDYPEIKLLEANGKTIKKEQVLELKNMCLEKPIMGKYIIYIIDGAEYLNSSSANTILKFLEEPEENIIGILVSNNRYQVINTLISRCQILSLNPAVDSDLENDSNILNFIYKIKNRDYGLFVDIRDMYALEKKEVLLFLKNVQTYCMNIIDTYIGAKIIEVIEEKKNDLKYNVNMKLFLDNLVLELIEVSLCIS